MPVSDRASGRPLVFVCGDLHNLGDLALLLQNLEVARGSGRPLRVRRWQPLPEAIERQVRDAGGTLFDGRSTGATLAAARGADVVIGGGQLVRGNVSPRSLLALVALAATARATGGSVVCRGLGVSRIGGGLPRWLWRTLFAMVRKARVRDAASQRNIASVCAPGKVSLTADMAFLDSALHARLAHGETTAGDTIIVAPCIDASEGRSIEGPAFAAAVAAAERRLGGARLAFACHDPRPGMDRTAAERLVAQLPPGTDPLIHDGYTLDTLFALYRSAGLVITNRLHAAIFSVLGDRPLLVIDDGAHKIAALAERFAIPSIPASTTLTPEEADRLVAAAIDFDRPARAERRAAMAAAAQHNLD
jgi:polysaccharide pyruvyl transferase WcaK-like protein